MLDNIKYLMNLNTIDKNISDGNFELAFDKLNYLIKEDFKPSTTYLKRGKLCKKLLMYDDAYSDFTYVITHCANKQEAIYERMLLNFEISNYLEAISDSNKIINFNENNFEAKRIKILSLIFSMQNDLAKEFIFKTFNSNKFKALHFLFNEVALSIAKDEFTRAFLLLDFIDILDKDNPIKLLKELNIYGIVGYKEKQKEIAEKIDITFPKYFVSNFKFSDIYQEKDLLEICFLLELEIFDKHGLFTYPFQILKGYKAHIEGHITESKEHFEKAIEINPLKPEGYVLLAQTLQIMSGYDNPEFKNMAKENYMKALSIYQKEKLFDKVEDMKRQLKHLDYNLNFT